MMSDRDNPWPALGLGSPGPNVFLRGATELARAMLGMVLATDLAGGPTAGIIVETEAYAGVGDRGCHAFGGRRTPRLASLWGSGGRAYIFAIHSRWCFDVTAGPPGTPECVLVRAVEPLWGLETMATRRGMDPAPLLGLDPRKAPRKLTSGPAILCQALGIDGTFDGHDLSMPPLRLLQFRTAAAQAAPAAATTLDIAVGPRVGIAYAGTDAALPYRFWLKGNRFVSGRPGS